ncbi:hypothetical protein B0H34DRAFT_428377 [Crassisporium funariophilum]|nr:hypothetical protein B0H34DRAFT_428377 [Crassisporium funariophilum]
MKNSRCINLQKISLKAAASFTYSSKCSNHPLACPLCPQKSAAVWKYNLRSHIINSHPTADVDLYKSHFDITEDEKTLMKGVYQTAPRSTKKRREDGALPISDGHSTRMALRNDSANPAQVATNEADKDIEDMTEEDEDEGNDSDKGKTHPIQPQQPEDEGDDSGKGETHTIEPQQPIEVIEPPNIANITTPAEGGQTSRLQKQRVLEVDKENFCADEGCEKTIEEIDLLCCSAPGCGLTYHLTCQGLFERPSGKWFCDDECKKNAGWRVGNRKRRKKD